MVKHLRWVLGGLLSLLVILVVIDRVSPLPLGKLQDLSSVVKAADGSWLYVETNRAEKWRFKVDISKVDRGFIKTLLAYEDKRFYSHFGVDLLAMMRAVGQWIKHGRVVSGGSTITMQLARLLQPRERTIGAKLIEMFRALQLEWYYSKEQILSWYLTLAPYGGNVEGVVAASRRYFGKMPYALSASEVALLVVLPQSPERYRPDRDLRLSREARDKVLHLAQQKQILSAWEYKEALREKPFERLYRYPRYAPHVVAKVRHKGSHEVETTLDKTTQKQLEKWAKRKADFLGKETTLAVLVIRNRDAAIQAYLGSHDRFSAEVSGYVDMVEAVRSPGSTLKPFIYGLGFEQHRIHPHTRILDEKIRFGNYMPHNFTYTYTGEVSIAYALQHSLNIPAVKVLHKVGAKKFVERIEGYTGKLRIPQKEVSLAVALGGLGISMWQLSGLYVATAQGGEANQLHYLKQDNVPKRRLLSAKASAMVTSILRQTPPPRGFQDPQYEIAYKTGTSYGYRDTWCIAYNATYTVALWVGKPNNGTQLKRTGRNTAAPLAFEVFAMVRALLPQKGWEADGVGIGEHIPQGLKYFDKKVEEKEAKFSFVYPREHTRYRSAGCSDVYVEIKVQHGVKPYTWYIDGEYKAIEGEEVVLPFSQGGHRVQLIDSRGEIISREIWVDALEC